MTIMHLGLFSSSQSSTMALSGPFVLGAFIESFPSEKSSKKVSKPLRDESIFDSKHTKKALKIFNVSLGTMPTLL